jgi:quercetin dioxygenase-like cupin family protein
MKGPGGTITLFAFEPGKGLGTHTSPSDAVVLVTEGALIVTVDGSHATATAGTIVRLPGGVPHALEAIEPTRMVLVVLGSPREL